MFYPGPEVTSLVRTTEFLDFLAANNVDSPDDNAPQVSLTAQELAGQNLALGPNNQLASIADVPAGTGRAKKWDLPLTKGRVDFNFTEPKYE